MIQTSIVVHGDETGWREDGWNGYVWAFATSGPVAVRYFEHNRSRGHAVPKQMLGPGFRGWAVSDFCSAYNLYPGTLTPLLGAPVAGSARAQGGASGGRGGGGGGNGGVPGV